MSHRMRPIFSSRFAGIALTVRLKKEENHDPGALQGMLAAIDQGRAEFGLRHGSGGWGQILRDGRIDGDRDGSAQFFWRCDRRRGA